MNIAPKSLRELVIDPKLVITNILSEFLGWQHVQFF